MRETTQETVNTERQPQCCHVASNITLIKLLRFFSKPSKLLQKWVAFQLQLVIYGASIDADAPNQSLTFNVNKLERCEETRIYRLVQVGEELFQWLEFVY